MFGFFQLTKTATVMCAITLIVGGIAQWILMLDCRPSKKLECLLWLCFFLLLLGGK